MKRYDRILAFVSRQVWAIERGKLMTILSVLQAKASGDDISEEEIRAATGARQRNGEPGKGVFVLPIWGTIAHRMGSFDEFSGGTSTERIGRIFRQAINDNAVEAIVLDIDSFGGSSSGVMELHKEIRDARGKKPVVAVANSVAASAAYWIGVAADEFFVTHSGFAGSIGVWTLHEDWSERFATEGIKNTLIGMPEFKTEGNPFEPLSEEARAFMEHRVSEVYDQFVRDVAKGRGVAVKEVRNGFGQGRVLSAKDALKEGMIDGIATLDETVSKFLPRRGKSMAAMGATQTFTDPFGPVAEPPASEQTSGISPEDDRDLRKRRHELRKKSLTTAGKPA